MGSSLRFTPTEVRGATIVEPVLRQDPRGFFARAWCKNEFVAQGIDFVPVQANFGFSTRKGTLRGMHYQVEPALEAKLIYCTQGALFDVVVDLRPESPTYLKWQGVELRPDHHRMLYVPELCGHGYQTLEDNTELFYLASHYYTASAARGVRFDDPAFGIKWPLKPTAMSEQDMTWPFLAAH